MESYKHLQKEEAWYNEPSCTHHQLQPESAGGQSCCIPTPGSPTLTPEYCEADPRPQISLSVNISLVYSKRQESFGKKITTLFHLKNTSSS